MNAMNLNPAAVTITEAHLVERFNDELAARGDPQRLHVDRSTKLGDFKLQADGGPRHYLDAHGVESIARRQGILLASEAVQFNRVPMQGRAYAPT
jgi:hypothetical protein